MLIITPQSVTNDPGFWPCLIRFLDPGLGFHIAVRRPLPPNHSHSLDSSHNTRFHQLPHFANVNKHRPAIPKIPTLLLNLYLPVAAPRVECGSPLMRILSWLC
jgi:hypothetical protein